MHKYIKKFLMDFTDLTEYYNYLVRLTKDLEYIGITNEWLVDNYYLLVEYKNNTIYEKKSINKRIKKSKYIYDVLKNIVEKNDYNITYKTLIREVNQYQRTNKYYFPYNDIEIIKNILLFIYVDKLNQLYKESYKELYVKNKVEELIEENTDNASIDLFLKNGIDIYGDYNYILEINNKFKKLGTKSNKIFKDFNIKLEENNISMRDALSSEYQKRAERNLLVTNIFNNLKLIDEISEEDLYKDISKCEKILMDDKIYYQMDLDSKEYYRKKIIKLAKKEKISEIDYTKKLMSSLSNNDHIGFKLFKKKDITLKTIIYLIFYILISVSLSYFLSKYFIPNRIVGSLILLIPISQIVIQLINQIISFFTKIDFLPKMDYTKGIPVDAATMVVIPTIVDSKEKIKKMFDRLETFYIVNKSKNIYFTLLGDIKSSDKKTLPIDKEIMDYGAEYANKLNKKYKSDLFYFVYRKRIWNEGENEYLGYERKRGALLQFNRLLLHKMSKKDIDKYFNVNTLMNFKEKIKYVVSLDTDTDLVLNSLLKLIGCMDHPLNRPILNKEKNRVIEGYGIMQPRISVDIESTNKSLYSQIFAGIGGFDVYNSPVPNIHQDLFHESNFTGKGIYDLETFDAVLYDRFPDNLILSHDLLESTFMRASLVSDVEFLEDFPSSFLVDTSRLHRWARGDTQILGFIRNYIKTRNGKKEKNPITLLSKHKILDNVIRMFLYPTLLLIIILSCIYKINTIWWLLFVFLVIAYPIIIYIKNKLYPKKLYNKTIYDKNLTYGFKSLILRALIVFSAIPYYTYMYMDAFMRSIYRLFISHKNLLNWVTAEEMEKKINFSIKTYLNNFKFNLLLGIILLITSYFLNSYITLSISILFIFSPLILYKISSNINHYNDVLTDVENKDLIGIARRTWIYFKDNLTVDNNYLIPDNYQENREEKMDYRTSPTDIGYSLTSVISAHSLNFIDKAEAVDYLKNILMSVDSLKKWNGHLYNWYSIKTKEVLYPHFVSTIDSGNLVASLIVTREFLNEEKEEKLVKLCDKLINNTNFKKLYTKRDVFSIGFSEDEKNLSVYNYNKFASESRLTSFIAISKGDVPSKHWLCLDKSLTTSHHHKGLISWSGTAFEYFMPLLYMKNYPNTLLDEAYNFAHLCQKKYVEKIDKKLPWGISEAACSELDNSQNYKYRSFSVPYLKAKEEKDTRIVISPYSSLMAMSLYPKDIYENIIKFKKMNMLSKYGFYESYDYDTKTIVRACFTHHQGMSLIGITNYLKDNLIQEYFHKNVKIKTFEILLKEKVQIKANIDMKILNYKKYNYQKEKIENDIRAFNYISDMPEVSVLSNNKYTVLLNDRGNSFSRYRTLQLNRYRKITEQEYGMFLYIKDITTNKVWSNTYAPINIKPDKYEVIFAADKVKYLRTDGKITTKTEIIVTKDHHAEIRKYTFKNESDNFKTLELTTYTEPILTENPNDIAHKVFNNMFMESEYNEKNNSLITMRKSRENKSRTYMVNRLLINDAKDKYTYETDRFNFIGRGNTISNPNAINNELSNKTGFSLEPISSIRNRIEIAPNEEKTVYFICGFGRSKDQIKDIINAYDNKYKIERAFKMSNILSIVNIKNMNLTGSDMRTYNMMLNYLYQTTKIAVNEDRREALKQNALAQNGLWKFGVSGDRPIILVNISSIENISFVYDILKAFEYFKSKSIFVDIIIVNSEKDEYKNIINKEINDELYRIYTLNSFLHTPGNVTVIDSDNITDSEKSLLKIVPRLMFNVSDNKSLKDEVDLLQSKNKINKYKQILLENNLALKNDEKLVFNNNYGGFTNNGHEYVITNKNTPTPWSNVISNGNFGSIITNNGCGYTYAYNSGEFKITSWTNELVVNDKSEGIIINGKIFDPEKCIHGFGYSVLESETSDLHKTLTEFIPVDENIKVFILKLKNKLDKEQKVDLSFYINPTLGNFEEKTSRHILTEFMENENFLKLRNVYSIDYSDVVVFMSSSEKINKASVDTILVKDITTDISLNANEEKEIVFSLGCGKGDLDILTLIYKYKKLDKAKKELKRVKEYWNNKLSTITVDTPDDSLNYMLNGWYLYQTISSRLQAKAGFYQVSGAFGYRDQLQDSMNICMVDSNKTRSQILMNAKHQFMEGDVLHWWHEKNRFGLRSRYKDDYLWLVYATLFYLEVTDDKSILDEQVPFVLGDTLTNHENERGMVFTYSDETSSLYEHLLLSLNLSISSTGRHGLPLMGGGDWNDGMNLVGIKGKGESVWLGFFLYEIINKFIKLIPKYVKDFDIKKYKEFNEKLKDNLNKYAWDKEYYLRAFYDNGDKLGSIDSDECKIDLISQSFSILSNVIEKKNIKSVINSVEEKLVNKDMKIIKLLDPPFKNTLNNPGYIMSYPTGIRENGGQYTHATSWYIMALIKAGYKTKAYKYYQMINPINRSLDSENTKIYKTEPYVIAADIYSKREYASRGGWTWYTGSAGWFYRVGIEEILGIKRRGKYLEIDPHIPNEWKKYKFTYKYNNSIYNIEVKTSKENKILIDKKESKNNKKIKLEDKNDKYNVTVYIKGGINND